MPAGHLGRLSRVLDISVAATPNLVVMTTINQNPSGTPLPPPPPLNKRDAKAQVAAAKAYAKANRNWFARHKFLTGLGALVVLIIIIVVAASGGGSSDTGTAGAAGAAGAAGTAAHSTTKQKAPASSDAYGTRKLPIQDGDWRLDSVQLKDDGLGSFGGTARITYTGDDSDGGDNLFTITVFKGKKVVATLDGGASSVRPGSTATVQLLSTDDFVGGSYKYDFENNL